MLSFFESTQSGYERSTRVFGRSQKLESPTLEARARHLLWCCVMARQNLRSLTTSQRTAFYNRLNVLKSNGVYDSYVRRHAQAQAVHGVPMFLPWHRVFIREFEQALGMELPYWDWTSWPNSMGAPVGTPVVDGPFSTWRAVLFNTTTGTFSVRSTPGLHRQLTDLTQLPSQSSITDLMTNARYSTYDRAPWSATAVDSFRNRLEGNVPGSTQRVLHNLAHRTVGGDMRPLTSPNDPIFFLHHCNVDRLWASWQQRRGINTYLPLSGGPTGSNIDDRMPHLLTTTTTPRQAQDFRNFNTYDVLL